jgi:hypothetical protein
MFHITNYLIEIMQNKIDSHIKCILNDNLHQEKNLTVQG